MMPWVSIRPQEKGDTDQWWDCLCTAYDSEPTWADVVVAAMAHGLACRKGQYRWLQSR